MKIPEQLQETLNRDASLLGGVNSSIAEFESCFNMSGLPFFPEYTDHGPEHIEHVLQTAYALMNNESRKIITAGDAATLILAILLHDVAMHLSEDCFLHLIQPKTKPEIVDGFDDKLWNLLWEDFIAEAKRFDGRKLNALFGDTNPIRLPPTDPSLFTKRDRLLIGEFLRRHHPRMAHEIALFGVPSAQTDNLRLQNVPHDIADLAGLVARSHGLPLRSCYSYLEKNYSLREFKGVHAIFHMALLRVADYLQADAERAPQQILKVKQLRSPVSQGEWKAHHAIRDIRQAEDDPEAIFIDAQPKDVKTYLRIKELLHGLQTEIDASWAAIGEVYGRFAQERLDKLGLTLRRIHSNLDDATFAKSVGYIPCRATFHTANSELLRLLIVPLYGNGPEFGIRELLQNAVDAVLELQKYQKLHSEYKNVVLTDQTADVVIALDKDEDGFSWITVSDRGIGMTADTILNYYLNVGASFRNSEMWHQNFDVNGKSSVLRSGRFGIGVLASFLIGDEVHISTRYVNTPETEGIEFSASIDMEIIELHKIQRPIGTTIKIKVQDTIAKKLEDIQNVNDFVPSWDWYCLNQPSVQRMVNKNISNQNNVVPSAGQALPSQWRRLTIEGYSDVHWTYAKAPFLTCNGIIVMRRGGYDYQNFGTWDTRQSSPGWGPKFLSTVQTGNLNADGSIIEELSDANDQYRFNMPNISVFDPDANLPLNLQRTNLTQDGYPFQENLFEDVIKDFIAYTLVNAPTNLPSNTKDWYSYGRFYSKGQFYYPGIGFNPLGEIFSPFLFYTNQGVSLTDRWHLRHVGIERLMIYFDKRDSASLVKNDLPLPFPKLNAQQAALRIAYLHDLTYIPEFSEGMCSFGGYSFLYINSLAAIGQRILLTQGMAKALVTQVSDYNVEWKDEHCILISQGVCPQTNEDIMLSSDRLAEYDKQGIHDAFVSEMYLTKKQSEKRKSFVAEHWRRIVGDPIIPYDMEERRRKFAGAYEILETYIAAHESERRERHEVNNFD